MTRPVLSAAALASALVLSAAPATAQDLGTLQDGFWGIGDIPECIDPTGRFSTCPALGIDDGRYAGEESECAMSFVAAVPGFETAAIHSVRCQGEGESWTTTMLFMLDLDGRLTILDDYGPRLYLPELAAHGAPTGTGTVLPLK